jgi:hypothetical protein
VKRLLGRPRHGSVSEWFLKKMGGHGLDSSGSRYAQVIGPCDNSNETSSSI